MPSPSPSHAHLTLRLRFSKQRVGPVSQPHAASTGRFTARGFAEQLAAGVKLVVWQPDIAWCGGMTPLVQIYALAREHGIRVCPHRGSEVWSLHAMLALEHGSEQPALAESGRPWMGWVGGVAVNGGRARLLDPSKPGFGVNLSPVFM